MLVEAAATGFYTSPTTGKAYPRTQILTIEDLLEEKDMARIPGFDAGALTFKKAQVDHGEDTQHDLFSAVPKAKKGKKSKPA